MYDYFDIYIYIYFIYQSLGVTNKEDISPGGDLYWNIQYKVLME